MLWDFADYSGKDDNPSLPLLLSERSQQILLAVIQVMQSSDAWVDGEDPATFDEIDAQIASTIVELITESMPDFTPVGAIVSWVDGNTTPPKWIECNDNQYFQDEYPELYALIGDTYDYDNDCAVGRFYAPRLYNRFIYGRGPEEGQEVATRGGEETHTLTTSEIPAHNHGIPSSNTAGNSTSFLTRGTGASPNTNNSNNNAGGGSAHNNMPPFVRLVWIIKAVP